MLLHFSNALYLIFLVVLSHLVYNRYRNGLNRFDGPFLASLSSFWRIWSHFKNISRLEYDELHAKYGDVVRVGPRVLYFARPEAAKDIYYGKGFNKVGIVLEPPSLSAAKTDVLRLKSDFYWCATATRRGEPYPSLFSAVDEEWHHRIRKAVNGAYTMTSILNYEALVDETISLFLRALDTRFANREGNDGIIDLPLWLHYYALDNIEEISYSARRGCIETGEDRDGLINAIKKVALHNGVVGKAPTIDKFYYKNPIYLWLNKRGFVRESLHPTVPVAAMRLEQRLKALETPASEKPPTRAELYPDILAKLLQAKESHPSVVTNKEIQGTLVSNINAGSDTTAISLTALFYYILYTPGCYRKLQEEIDSHLPPRKHGSFDYSIPFAEAQKLPYLDACINEAFRIHPAFVSPQERVTPPQGAYVAGKWVPGNTIVACNSWTLHRCKDVFGEDVEAYRPERWLEASHEERNAMNSALQVFGAGAHLCIGLNIAKMEMWKLIPGVFKYFELELVEPERKPRFRNISFYEITGVDVRIRRR